MGTPALPYAYYTWEQALTSLALRLNDPTNSFWTQAELTLYLSEALQVWNSLTQWWTTQWNATYSPSSKTWQSTANSANSLVGANLMSPRYQNLGDNYIYTIAQYHLLEPPTANFWTGTTQFMMSDLSQALQRRRDELMQAAAINVGPFPLIPVVPGQNLAFIPDSTAASVLDIRRARYIPAAGFGPPVTIYREDGMAMEYFENAFPQTNAPVSAFDLLTGNPLTIVLDASPNTAGSLELFPIISGPLLNPPTVSQLLVPDDFNWILKFGMLADLLRKESESQDLARAAYCENRFQEGLELAKEFPWLLQARINNVPVDTPSIADADYFDNEWQSNPAAQLGIIRGGMDLFAISPLPSFGTSPVSVTLTLVEDAPLYFDITKDFIQVPRDVLDAILDEAQHLATFKEGGSEFSNSFTLHQNFVALAAATNRRINLSGIFATTLRSRGYSKQDAIDPRFQTAPQGA